MASASAKSMSRFLGPLLLLAGLLSALTAGQGILPFRQAFLYGLTLAASGLVVCGLQGLRSRGLRLPFLALLLAGGGFFAARLYYLVGDYRWLGGMESLRAMLPGYRDQLLFGIAVVSTLLLASCLLGLLGGNFRSRTGSRPKERKNRRRPRTAPVKSSRTVRSLQR